MVVTGGNEEMVAISLLVRVRRVDGGRNASQRSGVVCDEKNVIIIAENVEVVLIAFIIVAFCKVMILVGWSAPPPHHLKRDSTIHCSLKILI